MTQLSKNNLFLSKKDVAEGHQMQIMHTNHFVMKIYSYLNRFDYVPEVDYTRYVLELDGHTRYV